MGGGFGGHAVGPAPAVFAPEREGQPQSGHRREGQKAGPARHTGGGEAVGQGEEEGEQQHAFPPGAQGEELSGPGGKDLIARQRREGQQGGERPAAQLEHPQSLCRQIPGQDIPGQEGELQRAQRGQQGQQQGEPCPEALGLEALLVLGGQLGGRRVGGELPGLDQAQPGAAGRGAVTGQHLLVYAGGVFFRLEGLLAGVGLVVHVVGKVVRPAQQGVEPGPDTPAHALRHNLRDGLVFFYGGLFHQPDGRLVRAVPRRGGGDGRELSSGEVHHLFWLCGLFRGCGPSALGAVFRQDLVHGILPSARLFHLIGHGYASSPALPHGLV